jgi:hypothetical protein
MNQKKEDNEKVVDRIRGTKENKTVIDNKAKVEIGRLWESYFPILFN